MPLKLWAPRPGKTPNWTIRGSYFGTRVNKSSGTADRKKATQVKKKIEQEIERGEFSEPSSPVFASAVMGYVKAGRAERHLRPLVNRLGETPLSKITQSLIDEVAAELFPDATPATRNRQVYTPISAVLKHAGIETHIRRPSNSKGTRRVTWLWPEQAFRLLDEAEAIDLEFRILLTVLLYTGLRLSEALGLEVDNVRLSESYAYVPDTKNDDPRAVFLPPEAVAALANHPSGLDRPGARVFASYKQNNRLFDMLTAALHMAQITLPKGTAFHVFRHSWASWMRRFGGLDTRGLVATGAWRDRESASRYEHVVVTEEARKAELLPRPTRKRGT